MKHSDTVQRRALVVVVTTTSLPLLVALALTLFPDFSPLDPETLNRLIIAYGVLLLTYYSGARLGILLQSVRRDNRRIWLALTAPFAGLFILMLPFNFALATLVVGFGAQGAWDAWAGFRGQLKLDYTSMRSVATGIICLILIALLMINAVF